MSQPAPPTNSGDDVHIRTLQTSLHMHLPLLLNESTSAQQQWDSLNESLKAISQFLFSLDCDHNSNDGSLLSSESSLFWTRRHINAVREALSSIVQAVGPNETVCTYLLDLLVRLKHNRACLQVVVDYLPFAVEVGNQEAEREIIACLEDLSTAQDVAFLMQVLSRLSPSSLTERSQNAVFEIMLKILSEACPDDLPEVIRKLLEQITDEMGAYIAWQRLRCKIQAVKEEQQQQQLRLEAGTSSGVATYSPSYAILCRVARTILNCFVSNDCLGGLLAGTFITSLSKSQSSENPSGKTCNELELMLLVILSTQSVHEDSIDSLFDEWISHGGFPYESLDFLINQLSDGHETHQDDSSTSSVFHRLVTGLLRLSIFLLLVPARQGCQNNETLQSTQTFVLLLHQSLEQGKRVELVQSLLQLSVQATRATPETSSLGRKRNRNAMIEGNKSFDATSSLDAVLESVHGILLKIAQKKDESLVCFKNVLIDRLKTSHHSTRYKFLEQICSILCALVVSSSSINGLHNSELTDLIRHLLFDLSGGPGGGTTRPLSQVVNGMLLANEVLTSGKLSAEEVESVKKWVLQIVLPSTRRMLQPELGVHCLDFLGRLVENTCDGQNSSRRWVFDKIKMLLANTGLAQSCSQYQKTNKCNEVILGYRNVPKDVVGTNTKNDDILLCVNYFANQNDLTNPERWECITQWAFHLINAYLENVRHFSQRHVVLEKWVSASIEIAPLSFGFKDVAGENAFENLFATLNSFELKTDNLVERTSSIDDALVLVREKTLSVEFAEHILCSVMDFQVALLIVVAISSAILRSAFEELQLKVQAGAFLNEAQRRRDTQLLHYQIMKIYDLRAKSEATVEILKSFTYSIRRQRKRQKRNTTWSQTHSLELESLGDIAISAIEFSKHFEDNHFGSEQYVHSNVLWKCIESGMESFSEQDGVNAFLNNSNDPRASVYPVLRTIDFRSEVSEHLARILANKACPRFAPKAAMQQIFRSLDFVLDALPVIRKRTRNSGNIKTVEALYTALVRHAIANMQLLFNILVSSYKSSIVVSTGTGSSPHGSWGFLEWCTDLHELVLDRQIEPVGSRWAKGLFRFFSEKLRNTDVSDVAHCLLELMSFFAVTEGGSLLSDMVKKSWSSLQLVYHDVHINAFHFVAPYVLSTVERKPLNKVAEAVLTTAVENISSRRRTAFLQTGLLRHWGLLALPGSTTACRLRHLYQLVNDLKVGVQRMDAATQQSTPTTRSRTSSTHPSRTTLPMPSIPSLDSQTLPECFETVASMIVGSIAVASPVSESNSVTIRCGPYQHMKELFKAHRLLIEMYQENIVLFSTMKRMSSSVFLFNRFVLAAAGAQLHQCVQWRNAQPPLSACNLGAYDPGSLSHLSDFLGVVASNTVGMLCTLCGFSIEREVDEYPFKPSKLRPIIGKIEREIKSIAATNNLPPPSFDFKSGYDPVELVYMSDETDVERPGKENSIFEAKAISICQEHADEDSQRPPSSNRYGSIPLNILSTSVANSDDDSFGVKGGGKQNWGESDEDDECSTARLDIDQTGALPGRNGAVKLIKRL